MSGETIFFPMSGAGDYLEPHSWITLEDERFCLGQLDSCKFCSARRSLGAAGVDVDAPSERKGKAT